MENHGTTSDNKDTKERRKARYESTSQDKSSNPSNEMLSFKLFSDSDIMKATNDKSSLIGKGAFGSVYKGTIANAEVAIKILDPKSTQGAKEFVQEMEVLKDKQHENLVKLMGTCLELRSLVYEYVPNGSVEDCLINSPELLTWKIRIRIVCEICSALNFLHSRKPKPLVHGDLKPHNILLDANLQCKLADFGLSRFLPEASKTTGAFLVTKNISGTEWYIDPDYLDSGKLTPSSDVYSLGVTILRILTGQLPHHLYKKVRKAYKSKSLMEVVDATAGDWPVDIVEYLANYGMSCCKDSKESLKLMIQFSTYLKEYLAEHGSKQGEPEEDAKRNIFLNVEESVDALINCVVQKIGFNQGKPVAAFTIYRCLLHWKSFESERTEVFYRLIEMIGSAIEKKKKKKKKKKTEDQKEGKIVDLPTVGNRYI